MEVSYTNQARADLKELPQTTAQRIIKKVFWFSQQSNPLQFAKALTDFTLGTYRFRVGDYRVVFDVDKTQIVHIIMILQIKHRKDIYRV